MMMLSIMMMLSRGAYFGTVYVPEIVNRTVPVVGGKYSMPVLSLFS